MTKKRSIIRFTILTLAAVLGILLCFVSFKIPFTDKQFNGFANSISMGLDVKGGVLAVYEASVEGEYENEFETRFNATIRRLSDLLTGKGYTEATVTAQGTNKIRVEVPDVDNPDTLFDLIGSPAELEIRETSDGAAVLTGKNIKNAYAAYQNNEYGVVVQFDDEGSRIFADLTSRLVGSPIYIVIDGSVFSNPTINETISGGSTFINGMGSQTGAENYAMKILSGTFSVKLELQSNSVVSATLGADALRYGLIAGAIGIALIIIFLICYYGIFGLLASFALTLYGILFVFFLQAIPGIQLTLPGIAGIFLSLGMAVDGNIIIFERIKEEYRSGKKIPASIKSGFKNALSAILDSNITTIIAAFVLFLLGSGSIKGFAIVLLIGNVISVFTSVIVTRALIKMYLPFNSTRPKPLRLKREVTLHAK
ncbi:MAG: protein translocase subunit SecD [Christensenellaceae bacterium]|nr:protein translocase subunit SecD [Christensenellaceae bacterium]